MKHLGHTLENIIAKMCNILIYFCNIDIKHLQRTYKILEIDTCIMQFQRNISLLLGRMDSRWRVEFSPSRCGMHVGEFRFGHDELRRRARDVQWRAPPRAAVSYTQASSTPVRNELDKWRQRSS
jgi:hypothetical protein